MRPENALGRLANGCFAMAEAQRGTGLLWAPVALGLGIAVYFLRAEEPTVALAALIGGAGVTALSLSRRFWLLALLGLAAIGFSAAKLQTEQARAPVLAAGYFGPVVGRVVAYDRSSTNRARLTLDRVHLPDLPASAVPVRVRIVLGRDAPLPITRAGARIMTRARLSPPPGPVEPGGFDFRRYAWFKALGATGYSAEPVVLATPDRDLSGVRLFALRQRLGDAIRARMAPRAGGFAAAILTGDRSAVDPRDLEGLRASNLAHLLAISGLHMGLLTGVIFVVVRLSVLLVPGLGLRLPGKKIAAVAALVAGAAYLALSGGSVATQRAFIMACVVFVAVLVDRPALMLRGVAVAALAVLIWDPVSLLGPGFQMSFAATAALVALYSGLSRAPVWQGVAHSRHGAFLRGAFAVVLTSAVAGLATAPYSAFHFNQLSQYGLLANVLAVPAMGLLVMPAALLALVLWPVGGEWAGLALMEIGIDHILTVAGWVAARPDPTVPVPSGPGWVLGVLSLGGVAALILRGPVRATGAAGIAAALLGWVVADRPAVLLGPKGELFGAMTAEGRALNRASGSAFTARIWLENDGDRTTQRSAAARGGGAEPAAFSVALASGKTVVWTAADTVAEGLCQDAAVVIAPKAGTRLSGPCQFVGSKEISNEGARAWYGPGLTQKTAATLAGRRPWTMTTDAP